MTNEDFQKIVLEKLGALESQMQETNGFVKALMHRTEEIDAKYDALLNSTVTRDALARIETKVDILSHRVLAQDGEIQLLKQVK